MSDSANRGETRPTTRVFVYETDSALRAVLTDVLQDEGLAARGFDSMAALREVAASLRPSVIIADTWGSSYRSLEPSERFEIAEVAQLAPLILIAGQQWAASMTAEELGVACILPELVNLEQLIDEIRRCLEESSEA